MTLKIAIVGAGPAGCVLARLLQQSKEGVSVTIFEGEGDIDFRSQGGTLDLHEKTGQAALKAAGLYDEWLKYARFDGEAMVCPKQIPDFLFTPVDLYANTYLQRSSATKISFATSKKTQAQRKKNPSPAVQKSTGPNSANSSITAWPRTP